MGTKLKPRTYHIDQAAVAVCERYGLPPRLVIPWLEKQMLHAQKKVVDEEGLKEAMRGIVTIEGVNLSQAQKEFFRELFAAVLEEIKKAGGEIENKK